MNNTSRNVGVAPRWNLESNCVIFCTGLVTSFASHISADQCRQLCKLVYIIAGHR